MPAARVKDASLAGEFRAPRAAGDGLGQALPDTVRHHDDRALVACADGWIEIEKVLLDGAPCDAAGALRDGEVLRAVGDAP